MWTIQRKSRELRKENQMERTTPSQKFVYMLSVGKNAVLFVEIQGKIFGRIESASIDSNPSHHSSIVK